MKDIIKSKLNSGSSEEVYDSLIDIGKYFLYEYESEVVKRLQDKDPEVRRAAIQVLGTYWERQNMILSIKNIWQNDPDDLVRVTALLNWFVFFKGTKNKNVLRTLMEVINNDKDVDMRVEAIRGLYIVNGNKMSNQQKKVLDEIYYDIDSFVKDVDWNEIKEMQI